MPKYLIAWNAGYGENYEVYECEDDEKANKLAYENWHEEAENSADYSARVLTPELIEEYGLDEEADGDELPA